MVNYFRGGNKNRSRKGEGYIDYIWQWKDDSTRIVPKLSYVKEFKPWDWIVGTGIYLEDVAREIKTLKNKLLRITYPVCILIITLLAFIIRQSLGIENQEERCGGKASFVETKV